MRIYWAFHTGAESFDPEHWFMRTCGTMRVRYWDHCTHSPQHPMAYNHRSTARWHTPSCRL